MNSHRTDTYVGPEWVGTPKQGGIALILQCPGRTEGVIGRPIVGQAGRLMREWMNRAGIENYYITNICKYVPPMGSNDPTKEEVEACREELDLELAKWKPSVIIACGKYATDRFGFRGNQTKRSGQQIEVDGTQIFGMFHPSYVMRSRGNRRKYGELEGGILNILARAKDAAENPEQAARYSMSVTAPYPMTFDTGAVDVETNKTTDPRQAVVKWSGVSRGNHVDVFNWEGQPPAPYLMIDTPIGHHIQWDMIALGDRLSYLHPPHDTMIKLYEKDADDLSLKGAATRMLHLPTRASKDYGFDENNVAQDAWLTWQLNEHIQLDAREEWLYEHIDRPLIPIVVRCTNTGLQTDAAGAKWVLEGHATRIDTLREQIRRLAGIENPNSRDQIIKACAELGIPLLKRKTPTGGQSVDEVVLRSINHPIGALLLHWRDLNYQKSHYLVPLTAGWISFLYKIHGTETGRISTEKPNGQNFPEFLRRYFVAREGKKFVIGDYGGAEMVVTAEASGDKNLIAFFEAGRKPHAELARRIYGENYSERQYTNAKSGLFENVYGGGVKKWMEVTGGSKEDGQAIFDMIKQEYPEMTAYLEASVQKAYTLGFAETLFGRRRKLPNLFSDHMDERLNGERQAKNTPIQGTVGDMTKLAMNLYEYKGHRHDIVHQQHDEIIVECDEGDTEIATEALRTYMLEAAHEVVRSVPMTVEVTVNDRWGRSH